MVSFVNSLVLKTFLAGGQRSDCHSTAAMYLEVTRERYAGQRAVPTMRAFAGLISLVWNYYLHELEELNSSPRYDTMFHFLKDVLIKN